MGHWFCSSGNRARGLLEFWPRSATSHRVTGAVVSGVLPVVRLALGGPSG
ncbi:hypothetical protein Cadr_000026798 [Camelus dromedarius]|uniref:Uncharacterized protein n=1 Tax=Camelus dromedarius TaxID=9838 RepID=A0A5N4C4K5_CAMDR|nr:hypothetical protein Cadr_000026798 [Camelus dromedarius]